MTDAPLTEEFFREFGSRWDDAWNSHDPQKLLALLHPDIEWDDTVFWPEVIHGIEGMVPYLDAIFRAMPDVQFEEVQLFTAPEDGRALWLFRQSGSAPAALNTDKKFSDTGCDIWLGFTDGKLSKYLSRYEITEMMRQYDALPPRGGLKGGAYLLSLTKASVA